MAQDAMDSYKEEIREKDLLLCEKDDQISHLESNVVSDLQTCVLVVREPTSDSDAKVCESEMADR